MSIDLFKDMPGAAQQAIAPPAPDPVPPPPAATPPAATPQPTKQPTVKARFDQIAAERDPWDEAAATWEPGAAVRKYPTIYPGSHRPASILDLDHLDRADLQEGISPELLMQVEKLDESARRYFYAKWRRATQWLDEPDIASLVDEDTPIEVQKQALPLLIMAANAAKPRAVTGFRRFRLVKEEKPADEYAAELKAWRKRRTRFATEPEPSRSSTFLVEMEGAFGDVVKGPLIEQLPAPAEALLAKHGQDIKEGWDLWLDTASDTMQRDMAAAAEQGEKVGKLEEGIAILHDETGREVDSYDPRYPDFNKPSEAQEERDAREKREQDAFYKGLGKIGFWETMGEEFGTADGLLKKVPFIGAAHETIQTLDLVEAVRLLSPDSLNESDRKRYFELLPAEEVRRIRGEPKLMTDEEFKRARKESERYYAASTRVLAHMWDEQTRAKRGSDWGATTAGIISQIPTYMLELALTGGIATAARLGMRKGAVKLFHLAARRKLRGYAAKRAAVGMAKSTLLGKGGRWAAGAMAATTAQAAALPTSTMRTYAQRQMPEFDMDDRGRLTIIRHAEKPLTGLLKSFVDTMVEVGTERSGELMGKGRAVLARKLGAKHPKAFGLMQKVGKAISKRHPGLTQASGWMARRGQLHSTIDELGEEQLARILRPLLGIDQATEGKPLADKIASMIPSGGDFLAEVAAFGMVGGAHSAAAHMSSEARARRVERREAFRAGRGVTEEVQGRLLTESQEAAREGHFEDTAAENVPIPSWRPGETVEVVTEQGVVTGKVFETLPDGAVVEIEGEQIPFPNEQLTRVEQEEVQPKTVRERLQARKRGTADPADETTIIDQPVTDEDRQEATQEVAEILSDLTGAETPATEEAVAKWLEVRDRYEDLNGQYEAMPAEQRTEDNPVVEEMQAIEDELVGMGGTVAGADAVLPPSAEQPAVEAAPATDVAPAEQAPELQPGMKGTLRIGVAEYPVTISRKKTVTVRGVETEVWDAIEESTRRKVEIWDTADFTPAEQPTPQPAPAQEVAPGDEGVIPEGEITTEVAPADEAELEAELMEAEAKAVPEDLPANVLRKFPALTAQEANIVAAAVQKLAPGTEGMSAGESVQKTILKYAMPSGTDVSRIGSLAFAKEVLATYADRFVAQTAPAYTPEPKPATAREKIKKGREKKKAASPEADRLAKRSEAVNKRYAPLVGTRVEAGGKTWEYASSNDLGVPYFRKVVRGKAQKRLHTIASHDTAWAAEALAKIEQAPAETKPKAQLTETERGKEQRTEDTAGPLRAVAEGEAVETAGGVQTDDIVWIKEGLGRVEQLDEDGKGKVTAIVAVFDTGSMDVVDADSLRGATQAEIHDHLTARDAERRAKMVPIDTGDPNVKMWAEPDATKATAATAKEAEQVKPPKTVAPRKLRLTKPGGIGKPFKTEDQRIKAITKAAGAEDSHYAIAGIYRKGRDLVATDGHTLWIHRGDWSLDEGLHPVGQIGTVDTKGGFPTWQDVVPRVDPSKPDAEIDTEKTWLDLRKAAAFVKGEYEPSVLVVLNTDGTLGFGVNAPEVGVAEVNVYDGYKELGALNPKYLLDSLKWHHNNGDKTVRFWWPEPNQPFMTQGEMGKTTAVTMPCDTEGDDVAAVREQFKPAPAEEPAAKAEETPEPAKAPVDEAELEAARMEAEEAAPQEKARKRLVSDDRMTQAEKHLRESLTKFRGGLMPFSATDVKEAGIWVLGQIERGVTKLADITAAAIEKYGAALEESKVKQLVRQAWRATGYERAAMRLSQQVDRPMTAERIAAAQASIEAGLKTDFSEPTRLLEYAAKKRDITNLGAYRAGARDVVKTHRDLAEYAKGKLPAGILKRVLPALLRARTATQRTKFVMAVDLLAEHVESQKAIRRFKQIRKSIRKRIKEGKLRPDARDKALAIVDELETVHRTDELLDRMRSLKDHLDVTEDPNVPGNLIAKMEEVLASKRRVPLDSLDAETINGIAATLEHIVWLSDEANMTRAGQTKLKNTLVLAAATREVKENNPKVRKAEPGRPQQEPRQGGLRWIATSGQVSVDTRAHQLGGDGGMVQKVLVDNPLEGEGRMLEVQRDAAEHMRAAMEDAGVTPGVFKKWSDMGKFPGLVRRLGRRLRGKGGEPLADVVEVELPEATTTDAEGRGQRVEKLGMTRAHRVMLAWLLMDPQNRHEIIKNRSQGIVLEGYRNRPVKLTARDVDAFEASLTEQEKAVAQAMFDWVNGPGRTMLNEASVAYEGHEIAIREEYAPRRRSTDLEPVEPDKMLAYWHEQMLNQQGIFQPRTKSSAPIIVGDAFGVFQSHTNRLAAYIGKHGAVLDALRLLDDPTFKSTVMDRFKHGRRILSDLKRAFKEYRGLEYRQDAVYERWLRGKLANAHVGALGGKPQIALYQTVSILNAMVEMDARDVMAVWNWRLPTKKLRAELSERSPRLRARFEGGAHQILTPQTIGASAHQFYFGGEAGWRQKAMAPIKAMDMVAIINIYQAAKQEGGRKGLSGDELLDYAAKRTEQVTDRTQPTWDPITTSAMAVEARTSILTKLLTMFSSQRQKNINILIRASHEYARSNKGPAATARFTKKLTIIAVQAALIYGIGFWATKLMYGWLYDDDDHEATLTDHVMGVAQRMLGNWVGPGDVLGDLARMSKKALEGKPEIFLEPRSNIFVEAYSKLMMAVVLYVKAIGEWSTDAAYKRTGDPKAPKTALQATDRLVRGITITRGIPVQAAWRAVSIKMRQKRGGSSGRTRTRTTRGGTRTRTRR